MFCQTDESKLTLNNVQTLQTSNKILGIAASGIDKEILSCKLGRVHDLVAAEGKYHLRCYASFLRKAKKHSTISQGQTIRIPSRLAMKKLMIMKF